jgi:hypothetical protein
MLKHTGSILQNASLQLICLSRALQELLQRDFETVEPRAQFAFDFVLLHPVAYTKALPNGSHPTLSLRSSSSNSIVAHFDFTASGFLE